MIKFIGSNLNDEETLLINLDNFEKTAMAATTKGGLAPDMEKYVEKFDPAPEVGEFAFFIYSAMGAGEIYGSNLNADYFEEEELKDTYKTFREGHVYENHVNKDPQKSVGKILYSSYNDVMHRVELFVKVDRKKGKKYIEDADKNKLWDVSMGVKIDHDVCSICGKKVKNGLGYCTHIKNEKNKINPKNGKRAYMINKGCKFFEISLVRVGADALGKTLVKVASISEDSKEAEMEKTTPSNLDRNMIKFDDIVKNVSKNSKTKGKFKVVDDSIREGNMKKAFILFKILSEND